MEGIEGAFKEVEHLTIQELAAGLNASTGAYLSACVLGTEEQKKEVYDDVKMAIAMFMLKDRAERMTPEKSLQEFNDYKAMMDIKKEIDDSLKE